MIGVSEWHCSRGRCRTDQSFSHPSVIHLNRSGTNGRTQLTVECIDRLATGVIDARLCCSSPDLPSHCAVVLLTEATCLINLEKLV